MTTTTCFVLCCAVCSTTLLLVSYAFYLAKVWINGRMIEVLESQLEVIKFVNESLTSQNDKLKEWRDKRK